MFWAIDFLKSVIIIALTFTVEETSHFRGRLKKMSRRNLGQRRDQKPFTLYVGNSVLKSFGKPRISKRRKTEKSW